MPPGHSTVVLFQTHSFERAVVQEYGKICKELTDIADVWLLFHARGALDSVPQAFVNAKSYIVTDAALADLPFSPIAQRIVPGSAHFPLLRFLREHSQYDYYWLIEYDVRFTSGWHHLLHAFDRDRSDFITSHIRHYAEEPQWYWWSWLRHPSVEIPYAQRLRSFNPVYRVSRSALEYIWRAQASKWSGHFEVLLPTLLHRAGACLRDFGGTGSFVTLGTQNAFYLEGPEDPRGILNQGTMRFRPPFRVAGSIQAKLYHPVKP